MLLVRLSGRGWARPVIAGTIARPAEDLIPPVTGIRCQFGNSVTLSASCDDRRSEVGRSLLRMRGPFVKQCATKMPDVSESQGCSLRMEGQMQRRETQRPGRFGGSGFKGSEYRAAQPTGGVQYSRVWWGSQLFGGKGAAHSLCGRRGWGRCCPHPPIGWRQWAPPSPTFVGEGRNIVPLLPSWPRGGISPLYRLREREGPERVSVWEGEGATILTYKAGPRLPSSLS